MKTTKKLFSILAVALLVFSSCKKEVPGPAGADGKDGTANVTSSTISISTWALSGVVYSATLSIGAITQDVMSNGAVLFYISDGGNGWIAMPYSFYMSGYQSMYYADWYLGGAVIYNKNSNLATPAYPGTRIFKIVTIGGAARLAYPDLDWNDYNTVKETFNLKD